MENKINKLHPNSKINGVEFFQYSECFFKTRNSFSLMNEWSVELYVDGKNGGGDAKQSIMSLFDGCYLYSNTQNMPYLFRMTVENQPDVLLKGMKKGLNHIVLIKTNSLIYCYTNGIKSLEYDSTNISNQQLNLIIKNAKYWGLCRVYDYKLTEEEVLSRYNNGNVYLKPISGLYNILPKNPNDWDRTGNSTIIISNREIKSPENTVNTNPFGFNPLTDRIPTGVKLKITVTIRGDFDVLEFRDTKGNQGAAPLITRYDNTETKNIWIKISFEHTFIESGLYFRCCVYSTIPAQYTILVGNIFVEYNGCISEYLPDSVRNDIWFDTSGKDNYLILNSKTFIPKLIYNKVLQDTIISNNGIPNIIPDFIGQKYVDILNNKYYIAIGLDIESWKLFKNNTFIVEKGSWLNNGYWLNKDKWKN